MSAVECARLSRSIDTTSLKPLDTAASNGVDSCASASPPAPPPPTGAEVEATAATGADAWAFPFPVPLPRERALDRCGPGRCTTGRWPIGAATATAPPKSAAPPTLLGRESLALVTGWFHHEAGSASTPFALGVVGAATPTPKLTSTSTYCASPAKHAPCKARAAGAEPRWAESSCSHMRRRASSLPRVARPGARTAPRGHSPLFPAFTAEAPRSKSRCTMLGSPVLADQNNGVRPPLPARSGSARNSSNRTTASVLCLFAARQSAVPPSAPRWSRSEAMSG